MMKNNRVYKRIEKNIARIGLRTYRIRVGTKDGYASSINKAKDIKRQFLAKM